MSRYGKAAAALLCAAALFVCGFALGSGGHRESPGPKRASAPAGGTSAIVSLGAADSIPSLHAVKRPAVVSPAASGGAGTSASTGGSTAGSSASTPATTTTPKPPATKPQPVRRRTTD